MTRRSLHVFVLALAGCAVGADRVDAAVDMRGQDAGPRDAQSPVDLPTEFDASVATDAGAVGVDATPPDGACWMTTPTATCGDGVCDPGCETALDCPTDCPPPMGGIACSGGPTTWACNANRSARYLCNRGHYAIEACGAPGSCIASPGTWPAQCHGCQPCDGTYMGLGTPYLWTCNSGHTARRRCIDMSSGGDCHVGASATCCAVDDDCAAGACISRPEGTDDVCP